MKKTTWGDPILNVQVFVPQEYIAGCYRIITDHPNLQYSHVYINYINPNQNYYNRGERFNAQGRGVNGTPIDGEKGVVNIFARTNFWEAVRGEPTPDTGQYINYLVLRATLKVKIQDGYAYYWDDQSTNVS